MSKPRCINCKANVRQEGDMCARCVQNAGMTVEEFRLWEAMKPNRDLVRRPIVPGKVKRLPGLHFPLTP